MNAIPRFDGVLFDLDGTLLDTLRDLANSMNEVLANRGLPGHPVDAYRYFVGDGAATLVSRALPESLRHPDLIAECLAEYRAAYARHWDRTTQPYDGIAEMLDALRGAGATLGVLSNKPHDMTVACVDRFLSRCRFACVLGQRETVARKPDPTGAYEAAHRMQLAPGAILYVGDTPTDMETARAAGMYAAGCTWGFRPESELRAHGAQAIMRHPSAIPAMFRNGPTAGA